MKSNEELLQDWYQSIIQNNIDRMASSAGSEELYEGWINDECWEINFTLSQYIKHDRGSYLEQPDSEVISLNITGEILIYNADGEISTRVMFQYSEQKNSKPTIKLL